MKVEKIHQPKAFEPISVTITFETQAEVDAFSVLQPAAHIREVPEPDTKHTVELSGLELAQIVHILGCTSVRDFERHLDKPLTALGRRIKERIESTPRGTDVYHVWDRLRATWEREAKR